MSCCTGRCFFITWCFLQLLVTLERQVFDFLGFMWAPIIVNFLHIIFVIVGIFGAYQYRHRIIIVYALWSLLWIGWNIFVICFYLQIGSLHREMSILNLGTKNKSWWLEHGIGCEVDKVAQPRIAENSLTERNMPHEEDVSGCLIEYYYVEVIQAAIHCLLALVGICVAIYLCRIFLEENDSCKYPVYSAGESSPLSPTSTLGSGPPNPCPQVAERSEEEEDIFLGVVVTRRLSSKGHHHRFCTKSRSCSAIHDVDLRRSKRCRTIMAPGTSPDPLARASFFSAHDSWTLPTYVSFNDDLESWSSLGLASRQQY